MPLTLMAVLLAYLQAGVPSHPHRDPVVLSKLERVVVFVVQKEVAASHIEKRKDACLAFDTRMQLNEKAILAELHREGLQLHEEDYCNKEPKGLMVELTWPMQSTSEITFEVGVALVDSDPIFYEGADMADLLRRGTYTVRYEDGFEPQLMNYQQDCCSGIVGKENVSEFCSSHTTAAYHSPQCGFWVVHDPNRVEDLKIPHRPEYHTYSRWVIGGQTYVLAYRDVDYQPADMFADIYLAGSAGNTLVGKIPVYDVVGNVSLVKLTGGELPELVFLASCGQLECVFVMRFEKGKAHDAFHYAASEMEIVEKEPPVIVAKSRLANSVEEFVWDPKAKVFRQSKEYRWNGSK